LRYKKPKLGHYRFLTLFPGESYTARKPAVLSGFWAPFRFQGDNLCESS